MTTTVIGILLLVQCILLWAIMAALHRHTAQLQALRERVDALRRRAARGPGAAADADASDMDGDGAGTTTGKPPRRGLRGLRR